MNRPKTSAASRWHGLARSGLIVPALLVALLPSSSYEDSLRRIQVFLTARQQKFGRRAHLAVTWRRPAVALGRRPQLGANDGQLKR